MLIELFFRQLKLFRFFFHLFQKAEKPVTHFLFPYKSKSFNKEESDKHTPTGLSNYRIPQPLNFRQNQANYFRPEK